MEKEISDRLRSFGFTPFFSDQLQKGGPLGLIPARIVAEHRGRYEVWTETGEGPAQISGKLMNELADGEFPGVGDFVWMRKMSKGEHTAIIEGVFDRHTAFIRGASGRQTRRQVVAANVDVVFAVTGLDADFSPRRIERYLARIWASGAEPVVVLNKADLCEKVDDRILEIEAVCFGVKVVTTSAVRIEGIDPLRGYVTEGVTAAFVGSSGAGKSTLINALLGEERMATGETRKRDGRGVHTTTHRQLIQLPGGGLLIDTPGMRELQLTDDAGLDAAFSDIDRLASGCRFRDCRHQDEPGCAVIEAVESNELEGERLTSYLKLAKEADASELRANDHLRRKSEKVWGQLYREGKRIRTWKESDE